MFKLRGINYSNLKAAQLLGFSFNTVGALHRKASVQQWQVRELSWLY
jgi:hypothetical protein